MRPFKMYLMVTVLLSGLSIDSYGDIGRTIDHFSRSYGNPVGDKSTTTGRIVGWKVSDGTVVMADFGPDGVARNVVYRAKGPLNESSIAGYLSKNSGSSGSFYKVDVRQLNTILANLPKLANDPKAPAELKKFAMSMNPQILAGLTQTINSAGDLRATKDGKFLAMIDTRGQVLFLKIDGPSLPLL